MTDTKTDEDYRLTASREQVGLIASALDMDSRLALGQLERILEHPVVNLKVTGDNRKQAEYHLHQLKAILFGFPPNASHGIHHTEVPDRARQAYDIQTVLRHRLAWDQHNAEANGSKPFGVYFNEPQQIGQLPLPTIEQA